MNNNSQKTGGNKNVNNYDRWYDNAAVWQYSSKSQHCCFFSLVDASGLPSGEPQQRPDNPLKVPVGMLIRGGRPLDLVSTIIVELLSLFSLRVFFLICTLCFLVVKYIQRDFTVFWDKIFAFDKRQTENVGGWHAGVSWIQTRDVVVFIVQVVTTRPR